MIPLVDTHCHLLAGLDDGPRTMDDAIEMCRMAWAEGTRMIAATAHINESWPDVTPRRIRDATQVLAAKLVECEIPITVCPCAEVMVYIDIVEAWRDGELLGMADRDTYLLIELPHGLYVDVREIVAEFRAAGVRPVLAHPERQPELLHGTRIVEELIRAGCLMQVSSSSITDPARGEDLRILKSWVRAGLVHLIASDGHSPRRRAPRMKDAYHAIAQWAEPTMADRLCHTNGMAVLQGIPLRVPRPELPRKKWYSKLW